jgi:hypothetical protein
LVISGLDGSGRSCGCRTTLTSEVAPNKTAPQREGREEQRISSVRRSNPDIPPICTEGVSGPNRLLKPRLGTDN